MFNTEFKNDFVKTEEFILELVSKRGISKEEMNKEADKIFSQIKNLKIKKFGKKMAPPQGY